MPLPENKRRLLRGAMNLLRGGASYFFTALLALLAGLGALALSGTTPLGEGTLCWQDNGQQVASDFGYVRGMWEGRHALDWSFACGGSPRSSFHPTFNNLVSPLTWAVAAIPGLSAVTGLSLLFLLQLSLLPLGVLFYLRRTFPRLPIALGMALALAYAFGGFVLTKHTFLPFLNIALLFPWFVAALDELLRRGRWLPYTLLLAFMLAVGTYFAYMWLLFAAVYAAARTGWRWHSPVRQHTLMLFIASAAALLLSAWSWLPSLLVTAASARAGEAHFWWNATRAGMEPSFVDGCCHLFLPLSLLLLLKLRLRWSRYALTLLVLVVGLACTSATTLWHLSRPWDFAGRFAYMAEFMLICLLARAIYPFCGGRRLLRWRWLPLMALSLFVLESCVNVIGFPWELPLVFWGCLALALSWKQRCWGGGLLLAALLLSCSLFLELEGNKMAAQAGRYQASADRVTIAEWAAEQLPQPKGRAKSRGFAAVENLAFFTPFDSLSHFTACITREQESTLALWGYQQRTAVISTEGGTRASDTLLGIRYILSQEDEGAPYRLEENPFYFGVGLMVPSGFPPKGAEGKDPIDCQQAMLSHLLGEEYAGTRSRARTGQPLDLSPDSLHYALQEGEELGIPWGVLRCEGGAYGRWEAVETLPCLMELPSRTVVACDAPGMMDFSLYHLPLASLEALKRYGQELPVHAEYAGRCMRVSCRSSKERDILFLPLLWQKEYEAEVDGIPSDVFDLCGLVGIPMRTPGEHYVELVYRGWGKWEGGLVSLISLPLLLGAWGLIRRRRLPSSPGMLDSLSRRLLLGVSLALLLWPLLVLPVGLLWR